MGQIEFSWKIAGIPCLIQITEVSGSYEPAQTYGPPERCYEAQWPEIDWKVLDRKGYDAPWLEKKMTAKERTEIDREAFTKVMEVEEEYDAE